MIELHARSRRYLGGRVSAHRVFIACVVVVMSASSALAQGGAPPAIPATPAGDVLRAWLDAYNSADSARLRGYAQRYEPDASVAELMMFRGQTGGYDVRTIERSAPRHLEATLRMRKDPVTVYFVVDVLHDAPLRARTAGTVIGVGPAPVLRRMDAAQRAEVIDSLAAKLVRDYVFAGVARRIADSLHARRARGVYDGDVNEIAFATHLQTELVELGHDKHLGVGYVPFVLPLHPSPEPAPSTPAGPLVARGSACAFERAEVLDDGVGYVKFNAFMHPDMCARAATAAMTKVANAKALIIDLRENGGGTPQMVAYVASYLVSKRTHLNDAFERRTGKTEQFWTRDDVPGPRFGGKKPIYVLTSSRTFSGAEEFAYDLQSLKRATIVGETTGGGAHMTATGRLADHLAISVPVRRAINPITHTNWEGVGVKPDVKAPAGQALETAWRLIRERGR
jgi:hypothetical protein